MTERVSTAALRAVFRGALRDFRRAAGQQGCHVRTFGLGGRRLRVVAAGAEPLAMTTAALAHLQVPSDASGADATICTWAGMASAGLVQGIAPGVYVAAGAALQATVEAHPPALMAYAGRFRLGVAWRANALSPHAFASPLRSTLAAALRPFGLVGLHAAVVGGAAGGALLAGASGAGKSTTALACALDGMALVAEDFCLVQPAPTPTAFSLFNSAKLTPQARAWLSLPAAADTGLRVDDKHIYLLQRTAAITLGDRLPIRAVLVLHISGGPRSRLRRATRAEAVNALAPTSVRLMGLPAQAAPAVFQAAAAVARCAACYHLDLGTDLAAVPALVRAAIAGDADAA